MGKFNACFLLFLTSMFVSKISIALDVDTPTASINDARITLPSDAEHYGAVFDKSKPVSFYNSGRLGSGTLKQDYEIDKLVFAAGTEISFYEHGSVIRGTLKNDTEYQNIGIKKGAITLYPDGVVSTCFVTVPFVDRNLKVNTPGSSISFDREGRVIAVENSTTMSYPILGKSVNRQVNLVLNLAQNEYQIFSGTLGSPTLIAFVPTARNTFGHPVNGESIVVPALSTFNLYTKNPIYSQGQQESDTYRVPGTFILGGNNFGSNWPTLLVRDMRLIGIQIKQDLDIQGRKYKANDVVVFDAFGRVSHPPLP